MGHGGNHPDGGMMGYGATIRWGCIGIGVTIGWCLGWWIVGVAIGWVHRMGLLGTHQTGNACDGGAWW